MKKIMILLLVLLVAGFVMMSCKDASIDDACENSYKIMFSQEESMDGINLAEDIKIEAKKKFIAECKTKLKDQPAKVINCVAKAKSIQDLGNCEQK